jgi:hypothetical protein
MLLLLLLLLFFSQTHPNRPLMFEDSHVLGFRLLGALLSSLPAGEHLRVIVIAQRHLLPLPAHTAICYPLAHTATLPGLSSSALCCTVIVSCPVPCVCAVLCRVSCAVPCRAVLCCAVCLCCALLCCVLLPLSSGCL